MAVWGGLTNNHEEKRSKKQRRKWKIYLFKCRVPKNSKEREESCKVVMYARESWTIKKAEHRRIDAFELSCWKRLLRVPWTARRSNQSILKETSAGRTDVEGETPILWPPDTKSWLSYKDLDAGKDWRQEEKGMTEDEMAGWHHQLNGHEFE